MVSEAPPPAPWDARKVVQITLAGLAVAAVFLFLYRFRVVILSAFVGVVVAAAVRPLVYALARKGLRRELGAFLAFFSLSAITLGVLVLALPIILEQATVFAERLPAHYASLRGWLGESSSQLVRRGVASLPRELDLTGASVSLTFDQLLLSVEQGAGALLMAMAVMLFAFYWTIDGELGVQMLARLAPLDKRDDARAFIAEAETRLGGYVRAQLFTCLAVGVMAFVSYMVIGVPNALVFAMLAAVMELVPVIGPSLGAAPAGLVMLAIDPVSALWVIAATIVIQMVENYVLFPRFMGKSAGVHPLACLLAIIAFGALLGVLGVLLAIPLSVVLQLVFERNVLKSEAGVLAPTGRERVDVLRYDARLLQRDAHRFACADDHIEDDELHALAEEVEAIASELDQLLPREAAARQAAAEEAA